jgi:iron complex outermembrane receptor protein
VQDNRLEYCTQFSLYEIFVFLESVKANVDQGVHMRARILTVAISTLVATGSLAVMHMAIAAEPSGAESSGLEEIIVTATKRDTRLLDTPLSISVLSAGAIEKNRIVDVTDIEKAVPSFVFLHGSGSDNFLSIRGNSTVDDSSGTDQGVVMLVDDVARVSVADLQPQLYDLNRIEVLNGPLRAVS